MKKIKRTLALLLSTLMCVSMLPAQAYASGTDAGNYGIVEEEGYVSGPVAGAAGAITEEETVSQPPTEGIGADKAAHVRNFNIFRYIIDFI